MDAKQNTCAAQAGAPTNAPLTLSERLGAWKHQTGDRYGAVVASRPFDGSLRLPDDDALAYGGPYFVGESMSPVTRRFISGIPMFVALVEEALRVPCTCSAALGRDCATCVCRRALRFLSETLESKP